MYVTRGVFRNWTFKKAHFLLQFIVMDTNLYGAINLFSFSKSSCSTVSPIFRALVLGTSFCYASQKRLWSLHIQQTRGKTHIVIGVCLVTLGWDTAPKGNCCRQNLQNAEVKVLNEVFYSPALPLCLCLVVLPSLYALSVPCRWPPQD